MRKYLSFFRLRLSTGLQYRAAAFGGVMTQFAWGFARILMFSAFYRSNPAAIPMPLDRLSTYIWLQQGLLAMLTVWMFDGQSFSDIESGNVAYELCRPLDIYSMWFVRDATKRLSQVFLRCIPLFAVSIFLPKPYNLSAPESLSAALLFLPSLFCGFLLVVSFGMLIYAAAFHMLNPTGIRIFAVAVSEFLAGGIIPLALLPDNMRLVVELLPFASIQNMPFMIYVGEYAGIEAVLGVLLQLFWLILFVALGRGLIGRALKRVVVQGG
ncbi:MAG: ABC transporter permease [Oscillospiraceae bacterium]